MRRYLPHAIMLILVLGIAELMCFLTAHFAGKPLRFLYEAATLPDPQAMDDYIARRHPTLGWVVTASDGVKVDRTLARHSPAFPEPGGACVSVYGDSFAWGSDAGDDEAWTNVLARQLGCRVANYGVPGYGTDQALMRFEQQPEDEAPLVILTVFPDNLLRCTTHFIWLVVVPELDYRGQKPRYVLDAGGALRYEPMPHQTKEEMSAFIRDPLASLARTEFLEPTGYYARNRYMAFPYIYWMGKFVGGDFFLSLVKMKFSGRPVLEDYLHSGHPSGAFELTTAIIEKFAHTAETRRKKFVLLVLPDREIVAQYRQKNIWSHQELIDRTAQLGSVINMGAYFAEQLGSRNFRELEHPGGHYTTEGYAMVADRVRLELTKR